MQPAPQPLIGDTVTFCRDGLAVSAKVTSQLVVGETVSATSRKGEVYEVRNTEVTQLVTGSGIYKKQATGTYTYSAFCKRPARRPMRRSYRG